MKVAEEIREREGGQEPQREAQSQPQQRRAAAGKPATQAPRANDGRGFATEKQIGLIERRLGDAGIDQREFLEQFGITSLVDVPFAKVNEALDWIANAVNG